MISRKGVLGILIAVLMILVISICSDVYAEQAAQPLYLGIEQYRDSGLSYKALDKTIWKISTYSNVNGSNMSQNKSIYSIKGGAGFGLLNGLTDYAGAKDIRPYTQKFDLKNISTITGNYIDAIPTGENYNSLVWVLEHCYVPEIDTEGNYRTQLLEEAGISNKTRVTDDEIDVAQQLAIWYFTNEDEYKSIDGIFELEAKSKTDAVYRNIREKWMNGFERNEAVRYLFAYFVNKGIENKNTVPVTNDQTSQISINSLNAGISTESDNYILGPYSLIGSIYGEEYTVNAKLINGENEITFTILDNNKQVTDLNNIVNGEDFYISVPSSMYASGVKLSVTITVAEKTITYWSVTNAPITDQPVVEIEKDIKTYTATIFTPNLPEDKQFDLSLRKYVTMVNDMPIEISKKPVVDISPIINSTATTANYKHYKTPVSVVSGDIVIYTIRVYNEGQIDGYVTEITDYLPDELQFVNDEFNKEYGWTLLEDGRTLKATIQNNKLIKAFDGNSLDYMDIKLKCKVVPSNNSNTIITSISEITRCIDENGNEIVDRDSIINNAKLPLDLRNYKGKDTNRNDLSDMGYYYEGQEDDDDFEKLSLKSFDLALRKFVVKINDKELDDNRQPEISDIEKDKLSRTSATFDNGTTMEKTHIKNPVQIANGDVIVYTIRVYNEGEVDGKATEITDYLPNGLSLKTPSSINADNGWRNPSGDGKTIITNKLSDRVLNAYDGENLDYEDIQIECIVQANNKGIRQVFKNIAEITDQTDKDGNQTVDRDSIPNSLTSYERDNYEVQSADKGIGYQDDDDYEELVIPGKEFDLSLRSFISSTSKEDGTELNDYKREANLDIGPLANYTGTTANYKHQKSPVGVSVGDEVIYTIRVYNEGEIDGYVTEITNHIPPQLEYVNDEFNAEYGWSISADGRIAKTDITSPLSVKTANRDALYEKRTENEDKVIVKAFNGIKLDYIDVKIKCRVKQVDNLDTVITNISEITDFKDCYLNTILDRDSHKLNLVLPLDSYLPEYKGNVSNKSILNDKNYHYAGQEDDDDFETLILREFDLSLKQFISGLNEIRIDNRTPKYTGIRDENNNFFYKLTKTPVNIECTDLVEYTVRVYNEGNIDGYANSIKIDIPDGLQFATSEDINKEYRWKMLDQEGKDTSDAKLAKAIVTDYLSKDQGDIEDRDNIIKEFDALTMTTPNYKDVKVVLKVVASTSYKSLMTTTAEIIENADENGNPIVDRDSTSNNKNNKEDDIDTESIKLTYFDLSMKQFITSVNDKNITKRTPIFKITDDGNYNYEYTSDPIEVEKNDTIVYTLRLYNEGTMTGYASRIKEELPKGLVFLPDNEVNKTYKWTMLDKNGNITNDVNNAVSLTTDYLSKVQGKSLNRDNLIKDFDNLVMDSPDYRDVKIALKVTEPESLSRIITTKSQIIDAQNSTGKNVIDIDSTPNLWINEDDDQDTEKIKVKCFNLTLSNWLTQTIVIEDGKEVVTNIGDKVGNDVDKAIKLEIDKNKLEDVAVKLKYKIRVTNEGEIPGYASEITGYVPEGLQFNQADNPGWTQAGETIKTAQLNNKLLQPGESAEVEETLTWVNNKDNLGVITNSAEISKVKNNTITPSINSIPNNKDIEESDMDEATIIIDTKSNSKISKQAGVLLTVSFAITSAAAIFAKKYIFI